VNIPVGTLFTFTVAGLHPTSATQTTPGIAGTETMTVTAGPVSQNGFCAFAPGTWIVGTPVIVTETAVAPLPNGFTFADVSVSRITGLPSLVSSSLANKTATLTARNTTAEVAFTNYIFRPAILKICKIGATSTVTGNFSFTMSLVNPLTSLPVSSSPIIIPVNSCTFAQGPYPAVPAFPGIGTFNLGTQLTITEAASGTTIVVAVTSPTSPLVADATNRRGTITLNRSALDSQFNEISFTNAIGGGGSTAAGVSVTGRVLTAGGNGLTNAYVILSGINGTSRRAMTSAFGYFRFDDVEAGGTYILNVDSKRFSFTPRSISVDDELTNVELVAVPPL
ncbi:MAG: carboxypeptidase regulatory-like domain-containing protein, partial [Acidobacteriota bacterium]